MMIHASIHTSLIYINRLFQVHQVHYNTVFGLRLNQQTLEWWFMYGLGVHFCWLEKVLKNCRNVTHPASIFWWKQNVEPFFMFDLHCIVLFHKPLERGCPALFLAIDCPAEFGSNSNQTHLKQLIKVFRIAWKLKAGVFDRSWSWALRGGRLPGTGLSTPALKVCTDCAIISSMWVWNKRKVSANQKTSYFNGSII